MYIKSICIALVTALSLGLSSLAQADHHEGARPATMVWIVDPGGKVADFMGFLDRADGIAKELGASGKRRAFMNTFAGQQSNLVIVSVEFASLVDLAESSSKISASPEWQKLGADISAAGIRLVSQSVMQELLP